MRTIFFLMLPLVSVAQPGKFAANFTALPDSLLKNATSVVQLREESFELLNDGNAIHKSHLVVTFLSEDGAIPYFSEQHDKLHILQKMEVRLFDKSGKKIQESSKSDFKDYPAVDGVSLYTDRRIRWIGMASREFPYTVEIESEICFIGGFNFPVWRPADRASQAVVASNFKLVFPEDAPILTKIKHFSPIKTQKSKSGIITQIFQTQNVKPIKPEMWMPKLGEILPEMLLAPQKFSLEGYSGSMSTWADFGKFICELNNGRQEISVKLRDEIIELVSGTNSNKEKIQRIYRFVQQNTRYVSVQLGIGGFQAWPAQYVEENKFGDCKALSNFTQSLLAAVGIDAVMALVSAGDDTWDPVDPIFCHPVFNHAILYVPAEDVWLECTSQTLPAGFLGDFTGGRDALLITKTGGKLVKTPDSYPQNRELTKASLQISANGSARLDFQTVAFGSQADLLAAQKLATTEDELKKLYVQQLDLPNCAIEKLGIDVAENQASATFTFTGSMERYASKSGKRLFFQPNRYDYYKNIPPVNQDRNHAFYLNSGIYESDTIMIEIPDEFRSESALPQLTKLEFPGRASYLLEIKNGLEANTIIYTRTVEVKPARFPASEYTNYRGFIQKMVQAETTKLIFVEK